MELDMGGIYVGRACVYLFRMIAAYIIATIVLALIDSIRISAAIKQKKRSINHTISALLAVVAVVVVFIVDKQPFDLVNIIFFAIKCVGIRLVFFDPLLNIFNRNPIDFDGSTAKSDLIEKRFKITFWKQRVIGLIILAAAWVINKVKY